MFFVVTVRLIIGMLIRKFASEFILRNTRKFKDYQSDYF